MKAVIFMFFDGTTPCFLLVDGTIMIAKWYANGSGWDMGFEPSDHHIIEHYEVGFMITNTKTNETITGGLA